MDEKIKKVLSDIEEKYQITILFAVEAGSRIWGYSNNESDYDVRFVYKHNNLGKYISINKPISSYTDTVDNIDWQGWDIIKALTHLKENNPSIIEWLNSPIVYKDVEINTFMSFRSRCLNLLTRMDPKIALVHHYESIAKTNYHTMKNTDNTKIALKKYIQTIRPLALMQHLLDQTVEKSEIIINLESLVDALNIDQILKEKIVELIKLKKTTAKTYECEYVDIIDKWILDQLKRFSENKQIFIEQYKKYIFSNLENKLTDDNFDTVIHEFCFII